MAKWIKASVPSEEGLSSNLGRVIQPIWYRYSLRWSFTDYLIDWLVDWMASLVSPRIKKKVLRSLLQLPYWRSLTEWLTGWIDWRCNVASRNVDITSSADLTKNVLTDWLIKWLWRFKTPSLWGVSMTKGVKASVPSEEGLSSNLGRFIQPIFSVRTGRSCVTIDSMTGWDNNLDLHLPVRCGRSYKSRRRSVLKLPWTLCLDRCLLTA